MYRGVIEALKYANSCKEVKAVTLTGKQCLFFSLIYRQLNESLRVTCIISPLRPLFH